MQIFFACGPCQLLPADALHLIQHKSRCLYEDLPGPAGLEPRLPLPPLTDCSGPLADLWTLGHPPAQGLSDRCSLYLKCSSSRMLHHPFFKPLFHSPFYKEGFWATLKFHTLSPTKLHFPFCFLSLAIMTNITYLLLIYLNYYQLLQVWHKLCDRCCHLGCPLHCPQCTVNTPQIPVEKYRMNELSIRNHIPCPLILSIMILVALFSLNNCVFYYTNI